MLHFRTVKEVMGPSFCAAAVTVGLLLLGGQRAIADPPPQVKSESPENSPQTPVPRYQVYPISTREAVSLTNGDEILFTSGEIFRWTGKELIFARQAPGVPLDTRVIAGEVKIGTVFAGFDNDGNTLVTGALSIGAKATSMNDKGDILYTVERVAINTSPDPTAPHWVRSVDHDWGLDDLYLLKGRLLTRIFPDSPFISYVSYWGMPVGVINNRGDVLVHYCVEHKSGSHEETSFTSVSHQQTSISGSHVNKPVSHQEAKSEVQTGTGVRFSSPEVRIHLWRQATGERFDWDDTSRPYYINDRGTLVGEMKQTRGTAESLPFIRDSKGNQQLLPVPPGTEYAYATGINNRDSIAIGIWKHRARFNNVPILWEKKKQKNPDGTVTSAWTMTNLNTLIPPDSGWILMHVQRINNKGLIIGYGEYHGEWQSCLLVPTKKDKAASNSEDKEQTADKALIRDAEDEDTALDDATDTAITDTTTEKKADEATPAKTDP